VLVATRPRTGPGTSRRGGPAPSDAAATSCTASQTRIIDTSRCTLTLHHTNPSNTTPPPITAWAITPSGCTRARRVSRARRGRVASAASRQAPATRTTTPVSSRFPNSIHWVSGSTSGCGTGTRLPGKHSGHSGQPSPEPVTRTTEPVTAIPAWATTAATASARITDGETAGMRSRKAGRVTDTS
jgi:hypothetical protein